MTSTSMACLAVEHAVMAAVADLRARREGAASGRSPVAMPLRIAIGLSGGRDSMALLDAFARLRERLDVALAAIHVHHGLSAQADEWAAFCQEQCAQRDVALTCERVAVDRRGGESLEACARAARYDVLLRHDGDAIALAHHADDQAETLLLQLLRGAGPRGIAAMPVSREASLGMFVLRPFLALAASELAAYARWRGLHWVDDASNADARFRRNALRQRVVPALREAFPGYPATLVRAARHQAEAAALLDDLAELDACGVAAEDARFGLALKCGALRDLAHERPARARNLLRWFVRRHRLPALSTAKLQELLAQCASAREDSRSTIVHGTRAMSVYRGSLVIHRAPTLQAFALQWQGESLLSLPGGTFGATPVMGRGIATRWLAGHAFTLRPRAGGERLRVGAQRPRQALTTLFRAIGAPPWQRDAWPLVWYGDELVAVPGLGIDPRYAAPDDAPGLDIAWTPAE